MNKTHHSEAQTRRSKPIWHPLDKGLSETWRSMLIEVCVEDYQPPVPEGFSTNEYFLTPTKINMIYLLDLFEFWIHLHTCTYMYILYVIFEIISGGGGISTCKKGQYMHIIEMRKKTRLYRPKPYKTKPIQHDTVCHQPQPFQVVDSVVVVFHLKD